MATVQKNEEAGVRLHAKALVAMTFVSLSSFQYGLDFGVIGGLQAMIGFLKVRRQQCPHYLNPSCLGYKKRRRKHLTVDVHTGLRRTPLGSAAQVEHLVGAAAAHLIAHGAGRLRILVVGGIHVALGGAPAVALDRLRSCLRVHGHHAGHRRHRGALRGAAHPGAGKWAAHDPCAAVHYGEWAYWTSSVRLKGSR